MIMALIAAANCALATMRQAHEAMKTSLEKPWHDRDHEVRGH